MTLFLLVCADKDGYEGDDLNSVVPALHLDAMRDGLIDGYRYDWQPLSYQLSHGLYKVTNTPKSIFLISPISVAISILILFFLIRRLYGTGLLMSLCLLLMVPEVIYSGLYYNSHAPAFLLYTLAMWTLFTMAESSDYFNRAILIGSLASLAILFRFDYVLAFPMLVVMFYLKSSSSRYSFVIITSAAVVGLLALLVGIFNLTDLVEIYQTSSKEIGGKALDPGWNRYAKTMAMTALFSPLGWLFFLAGVCLFFIKDKYVTKYHLALFALGIVPMLYPIKGLLSVKYALPLLTWVLVFGAYLVMRMPEYTSDYINKQFKLVCYLLSAFFLVTYVNIDNAKPYVSLSFEQIRPIGTHDGTRSWGGCMQQFIEVNSTNHKSEGYIEAKKLLEDIKFSKGRTFLIVGKQNVFYKSAAGWRYLQLFLAEQSHARSEVLGKEHVVMYSNSNTVHLCEDISCLDVKELSDTMLKVVYPNYSNF